MDLDQGAGGVSGTTDLPVGQWTHVAAVWRGSDGFLGLYKNGALEASASTPPGRRLSSVAAPAAKLGEWGTVRGAAYKWPGGLDEVTVINRALSPAEIQRVYQSGVLGLPAEVDNDIAAGNELLIQGSNAAGHLNVDLDAFSNFGTVRLESRNGGYLSGLTVWGGVLRNEPGGVVTFNVGSGGPRHLLGGLRNLGTVQVNQDTTLGGTEGWFRNQATFNVATNSPVTLAGVGTRFEQAGGVLQNDGVIRFNQDFQALDPQVAERELRQQAAHRHRQPAAAFRGADEIAEVGHAVQAVDVAHRAAAQQASGNAVFGHEGVTLAGVPLVQPFDDEVFHALHVGDGVSPHHAWPDVSGRLQGEIQQGRGIAGAPAAESERFTGERGAHPRFSKGFGRLSRATPGTAGRLLGGAGARWVSGGK